MAQNDPPGAAAEALPEDLAKLSFEEALGELEGIVQRLEGGDVNLEESIAVYTRGSHLKSHCEAKLRAASEKVEKVVAGLDGGPGLEAADLD